jgi:glutaredoxin 3
MIEVHSKTICPFCHRAKSYLSQHGIAYQEYLYDDDGERQALYDRLGLEGRQRTVPQIFLVQGGIRERIGGYNDLLAANLPSRLVESFNEDF